MNKLTKLNPVRGSIPRRFIGAAMFVFVMMAPLAACTDIDELQARFRDRRTEFAALPVGIHGANREVIVAAMGQPVRSHATNLGGMLDAESLVFIDRRSVYEITLVGGRAWMKTSTPISSSNSRKD